MYGKLFASTFTGSMVGCGPTVFAVWAYVVAHTVGSQVELNVSLLAHMIGAPIDDVQSAIDFLCSVDHKSRTKAEQGRRLIREGEYAYRVPNWEAYRAVRNEDDRRAYNRQKQRERRERLKNDVNDSQSLSAPSAQADADPEADSEEVTTTTGAPGFSEADLVLDTTVVRARPLRRPATSNDILLRCSQTWTTHFGAASVSKVISAVGAVHSAYPEESDRQILAAFRRYCVEHVARARTKYASPENWAEKYHAWCAGGCGFGLSSQSSLHVSPSAAVPGGLMNEILDRQDAADDLAH